MQLEAGDDYLRKVAQFIRTNEQNLAEGGFGRRRRIPTQDQASLFNPLSWLATQPAPVSKPVVFKLDPHHLFYILMRIEALGIDVGTLDVQLDNPSRPTTYIDFSPQSDKSDALSMLSFRSSLSVVSNLSLSPSWWGRTAPPSLDAELKYIYSSFTKLPALVIHAPTPKIITELANQPSIDSAIPLDPFKNLQSLQISDVDPRILLGWDRIAESVRSLTIKRSGLEDVTDVFINLVVDDQDRREGKGTMRRKRIVHGPSRQSSFCGTKLPDTVPEVSEDLVTPTNDHPPPAEPKLSSLKWAFLKHLCLAENSLTFFPTTPLPHLTSLTHLDLSSNLLVSVPPGLSTLYNLVSLNLSDNMIDSVLGIYQRLGQVLYLNLSQNRLESICGLERLPALERVDLRNNVIEESAEVGRLAALPNIAQVWVDGNPLVEFEEGYRIRCFDYFWKEGKSILLDDAPPSFYEKRFLTEPVAEQMNSARPVSSAPSPPIVAVGKKHAAEDRQKQPVPAGPALPSPVSIAASSQVAAAALQRGRKKKNKRIVDLDGGDDSGESIQGRSSSAVSQEVPRKVVPDQKPIPAVQETLVVVSDVTQPKRISRHGRHHTEAHPSVDIGQDLPMSSNGGSLRASRAKMRRARASTSVFEPSANTNEDDQQREADAFRARIEALRADMGDGWLKVLNQSQLGSPPVRSR